MKEMKMIRNLVTPVVTHGALLIFSIITSRTILIGYGSETNGLISSVNQIFNYLALMEAGIGTATTQALYTAIAKGKEQTKDVLGASQSYFRNSALLYFLAVIATSFIWPALVKSTIPYWTIFGLIFFQGLSNVISFSYASTISCYLSVMGSHYINNNVHFCTYLLSYVLKLLICGANLNITYISLAMVLVNIGKCIFLRMYLRYAFPEIMIPRRADTALLMQRNSFLVHEISGVIFYSTDTIIISLFCGLNEASIYAVYSLVLSALRNIIGQAFSGTKYILGSRFGENKSSYERYHDTYNSVYMLVSFVVYTVALLLLIPFVTLYTKGVEDKGYINPILPILFVLVELLSSCRVVDAEVIRFSYHAKNTVVRSIIEAAINLLVSLVCVQFLGIYGVLIGTIVALSYRANDVILYTNHRILKRSAIKEYRSCLINFAVLFVFVWCTRWIQLDVHSFPELIGCALCVFLIVLTVYTVVNLLVCRELQLLLSKLYSKIGR